MVNVLDWPLQALSLLETGVGDAAIGGGESIDLGHDPGGVGIVPTGKRRIGLDPVRAAVLAQKAENTFVGVNCGIMDQFVCRLGRKGHALFLDCRSLAYENVPLRLAKHGLLIVDTKVKRELAASAYNQRRAECEEAVRHFRAKAPAVKALRDVDPEMFALYQDGLPETARRRAAHVARRAQAVRSSSVLSCGARLRSTCSACPEFPLAS